MKVVMSEKLPIKLWLEEMEDGAWEQAKNLANLPFVYKHVAIMPDSHQGYGMPIGGVLATKGVVIPNAVGVDIACGMCAVKSNIKYTQLLKTDMYSIMQGIRNTVPVGFKHHEEKQDGKYIDMPSLPELYSINDEQAVTYGQYESAKYQLGTLGGGNHFIEIQADEEGYIWVMIHSGSRNVGKKVCDHWNDKAKKLNEKWYSGVDPKWDLAFLPIESPEGKDYMAEMNFCVDFAFANRYHMMEQVKEIMHDRVGAEFGIMTNIAHNYAAWENHFGQNVLVHRKGATRARLNEVGIIPGSQGTSSYIVVGLGNKESFESCSHGAGRKMGRKEAERSLNLAEEIAKLDSQGIIHGIRHKTDLDEAAGAYKDIDVVMENQKDLVQIQIKLRPLAVIKG